MRIAIGLRGACASAGECAVEPIAPAPRLDMLAGKAIAHVGSSFMACVTHSELKRLILAEYPSARIILPDEIGSAGPYQRPDVVWREKDAFQRKLGEQRIPDFLFLEGAGMQTRTGNSPMFTGVQPLENRTFFHL